MVSESRGSAAGVSVTAMEAVPVTTLPSGLVNRAEMVALPVLTPVTMPVVAPTEAMDGTLEVHWTRGEVVTFCRSPVLPEVPSATS